MRASATAIMIMALCALCVAGCAGGGDDGGETPAAAAPPPASPPTSPPAPPPPSGAATWEWILQQQGLPAAPPAVAFLDVDGFDTPPAYVAAARSRGVRTICYLSVGTAEDFRPDYSQFAAIPNALARPFPGFPGERYLNVNVWRDFIRLMEARIRMCRDKGYDFVEFDNMDAFLSPASETGFTASEATALAYIDELARLARSYNLGPIQKNMGGYAGRLEPQFAGFITEECVRLNFCSTAAAYVRAGKPVLNAEYPESWARGAFNQDAVCRASQAAGVSTIITVIDLDAPASARC